MVEKTNSLLGKRKQPEPSKEEESPNDDQVFDATIYVVKDSLRFVKPYSHEFTTFAKRRWVGQSLLDVFSREFKAYSSDYYTKAIESGKIRCNGK